MLRRHANIRAIPKHVELVHSPPPQEGPKRRRRALSAFPLFLHACKGGRTARRCRVFAWQQVALRTRLVSSLPTGRIPHTHGIRAAGMPIPRPSAKNTATGGLGGLRKHAECTRWQTRISKRALETAARSQSQLGALSALLALGDLTDAGLARAEHCRALGGRRGPGRPLVWGSGTLPWSRRLPRSPPAARCPSRRPGAPLLGSAPGRSVPAAAKGALAWRAAAAAPARPTASRPQEASVRGCWQPPRQ